MQVVGAQRVLVYGVTGAGKTTLAAAISARTGVPWHAVDDLTWEPRWTAVPLGQQRDRIDAICRRDQWILDTAYSQWLDVVLPRVDLVVGLDYPRWLSLTRVVRRTVARITAKRSICNGNVETIRGAVSRESIIAWHFRSFRRKRDRMRSWAAGAIDARVVLLRSPRKTRQWLATLASD